MDRLDRDARAIFDAAVRGAQADRLLEARSLSEYIRRPIGLYRRIVVAGMGKAAMAMAGVVEEQLEGRLGRGVVVVPESYPEGLPAHLSAPERIRVLTAAHPIPDISSARAARRMLDLASGCGRDDLLLVLVSGGGTSLCNDFAGGISLAHARRTYELLQLSGAEIHAMNAVRKHLSRIGGGQLARAAAPAEVVALVVSDVVGDDLSVIASGPTVPDPSTFADAAEVLHDYGLWNQVPESVREHLEAGARGEHPETAKPDEEAFAHAQTVLLGSNRDALRSARAEAERRGYQVRLVQDDLTGEASEVGRSLAARLLEAGGERPLCLLWGGETTVTVRGAGRGGRNQELALAAALGLDGAERRALLLSGGTDGIDGPTPAAGAWATPQTVNRGRRAGLDAQAHLEENDSHSFFEQLGTLLTTGPTHTNVCDVQVGLVR